MAVLTFRERDREHRSAFGEMCSTRGLHVHQCNRQSIESRARAMVMEDPDQSAPLECLTVTSRMD